MRKKLVYLLLFGFSISLTACASVSSYIKTQRSQYLHSQNLSPLKAPTGLQVQREERYNLRNFQIYNRPWTNRQIKINGGHKDLIFL